MDLEYICEACGKRKQSESALEKHAKRHRRPYGCTFPRCKKRFGSCNDWKRHENSQHFLDEMWRCDIERSDGATCAEFEYNEQRFAVHLQREHNLTVESLENKKARSDMRLGREAHQRFWCGFCNTAIRQEAQVNNSPWSVRQKHIRDHFDKDNCRIEDWIDIEENKTKGIVLETA